MPALFVFLFKVNVALLLFCMGYYLVLRHLTFYTLNRAYLVIAILFSTLYPGINLSAFAQRHQQLTEPMQRVIINWKIPAEKLVQPNYWQWVEIIFWAGVVLFTIRLITQLLSLYKLYRQSKPGNVESHYVRLINEEISPFSFWRSIYINPSKLSPSELKSVLEHEQVHVKEWHTLDILLAELSTIFYWFNPGVWLMKKAVRENIEFITDRKILQKGMDIKEYQYSLISVSLAAPSNSIVNHFNMSTIKKRIIMMNTKRSSGYKLTRYVFLVPVVVALLLIFSLSKAEVAKKSIGTVKSIVAAISHGTVINNYHATQPIVTNEKPVQLHVTKIKTPVNGADTLYAGRSRDGKKSLLFTSEHSLDSTSYAINGVPATRADIKALDPAKIVSLDLVNAQAAKEFYDEPADVKPQVLFITTNNSEKGKKIKEKIDHSFRSGTIAKSFNMSFDSTGNSPDMAPPPPPGAAMAYTITSDNKSSNEESNGSKNVSTIVVTDVNTDIDSKTLTVKKDYHVTGKASGDFVISTDVDPKIHVESFDVVNDKPTKVFVRGLDNNNDQLTIDGKVKPLIIIDGKEARTFKNLAPENIKSISILKDGTAEKKYGEKGKNGVVEVTTKKQK